MDATSKLIYTAVKLAIDAVPVHFILLTLFNLNNSKSLILVDLILKSIKSFLFIRLLCHSSHKSYTMLDLEKHTYILHYMKKLRKHWCFFNSAILIIIVDVACNAAIIAMRTSPFQLITSIYILFLLIVNIAYII